MIQTATFPDSQLTQILEYRDPGRTASPLLDLIADETPLGIVANDTESMELTTADVSMLYQLGCIMQATTPPIEKPAYEPVVLLGKVKVKKYRKMQRERRTRVCYCGVPSCDAGPFNERIELEEYEEEE